jgi:hypothetical protein
VTFILLCDDKPQGAASLVWLHTNQAEPEQTAGSNGPKREVTMKYLWAAIPLLLLTVSCGGYGSGMGTTPAPMPMIAPASGMYVTPLTVTISDSLSNAVIYVTTDGSTPTLSSPIYRGPITLSQAGNVSVRALAAAGGYASSSVVTVNFTLQ